MDSLERDYFSVLLADHAPPCLSLYQPTHRTHPERQQDRIRFRNLVKELGGSLGRKYPRRATASLLAPFERIAKDHEFWTRTLDGLAVLATGDVFKVYRLQRGMKEHAIVAGSFHTKPLMRILQSADRYQILGVNRHDACLFEGNRDALDDVDMAPEVIGALDDARPERTGPSERKNRVYGPSAPGATARHGTGVRQDESDKETDRFFRAVDRAVLEHHSRSSGLPLLLAALPEHHHRFRALSRNPFLAEEAIDAYPDSMSVETLRERAWALVLPRYLERLDGLVERFGAAASNGLGADDLAHAAGAAVAGRIETLLIEADRHIPGRLDAATGAIAFDDLGDPEIDDLLDDLGERVVKSGGEVVIVPAERMPTQTGLAAIYRY